jgi:hypothetical protein
MPDNLNMDEVMKARRKSVAESIRPVATDELKALGNELFPTFDHPWREVYFNFVTENANASFYHAVTDDGIHIIYCHTKEKGMWFMPGTGMGPLQPNGLKILKEVVQSGK